MSSKGVAPPNGAAGVAPPNGAAGVAPPNGAATLNKPKGAAPQAHHNERIMNTYNKKPEVAQPSDLTGEAAIERSRVSDVTIEQE